MRRIYLAAIAVADRYPFRVEPFESRYGELASEIEPSFEVTDRKVFDLPFTDLPRHIVHDGAMNQKLAIKPDQPMALGQVTADPLDRRQSRLQGDPRPRPATVHRNRPFDTAPPPSWSAPRRRQSYDSPCRAAPLFPLKAREFRGRATPRGKTRPGAGRTEEAAGPQNPVPESRPRPLLPPTGARSSCAASSARCCNPPCHYEGWRLGRQGLNGALLEESAERCLDGAIAGLQGGRPLPAR